MVLPMSLHIRQLLLFIVGTVLGMTGVGNCASAAIPQSQVQIEPCSGMTLDEFAIAASQRVDHSDGDTPLPNGADDCARKCHAPVFAMPLPGPADQPELPMAWHAGGLSRFTGVNVALAIPPPRLGRHSSFIPRF
jgi:hypothetical protein